MEAERNGLQKAQTCWKQPCIQKKYRLGYSVWGPESKMLYHIVVRTQLYGTHAALCLLNVVSAKYKNYKRKSSSGKCLPCKCHVGCHVLCVAPILALGENFSNKVQVRWKKVGGGMENLAYLVYLFSFQLSTGLFFCLVLGSMSLIPSVLFLFSFLCCRWFHAVSIPLLSCNTDSPPEPRPRCWTPCSYGTETRCWGHDFLLCWQCLHCVSERMYSAPRKEVSGH